MVSDRFHPSSAPTDGIVILRRQGSGLRLRLAAPCAALRDMVQCYWWARGTPGEPKAPVELLHPDGGMGLAFNFGVAPQREAPFHVGTGWVDGPSLRTVRLRLDAGVELFGVRFLPGMGGALLGELPEALAEAGLMPAEALRRRPLMELHERLGEAGGFEARIALLEGYLLAWRHRAEAPPAPLGAALEWLRQQRGQGGIAALAEALPTGQRQLQRLFRHHLGLSPKQYARVLRIEHGRSLIKRSDEPGALTEAAYAAGYFDQAHFVHDFAAVVGLTPGEYRRHVRLREGRDAAPVQP